MASTVHASSPGSGITELDREVHVYPYRQWNAMQCNTTKGIYMYIDHLLVLVNE